MIWFLVSLLSKIADPLMKLGVPLTKNILVLLGTTAAASAATFAIDAVIQKKIHGSGKSNNNNFKWRNE